MKTLDRQLTVRERAVAAGVARGMTYAQIAAQLGLNVETVRTHAAGLRRLLRTNKAGIAAWAATNLPGEG